MSTNRFEVRRNNTYIIKEKATADTPSSLYSVGRSKMGGMFFEFAGCPWDETNKRYDTGLDKTSREFRGKSEQEVNKILNERKELVEHLENLIESHSTKDRNEVIAGLRMKVNHNMIVKTDNPDTYLRLFLAMRGKTITPYTEKGNLGKYGSSMYVIEDLDQETKHSEKLANGKMKVLKWLFNKLDDKKHGKQDVLEVLRHENILSDTQTADNGILVDLVTKRIEDVATLDNLLHVIEKVPMEDVIIINKIKKLHKNNSLRKERTSYVIDGVELGTSYKEVANNLKKPENADLAIKYLG